MDDIEKVLRLALVTLLPKTTTEAMTMSLDAADITLFARRYPDGSDPPLAAAWRNVYADWRAVQKRTGQGIGS